MNMDKQLQDNRRWVSSKKWVLFVFLFSIALLSTSLVLIETNIRLGNNTIAGFLIVSFILLVVFDFWLLLKEITKTKKENKGRAQQKEFFGTSLNSIAEGLITTGKDGDILFMNPAAERITGWRNGKVKNLPLIVTNSGSSLFDVNGNISGSVLVFNDVTEKKKIEDKLNEREKQYRDLIQNLPVAVYTCDEFGYIQLYNKAAVALWGREPVAGSDQWVGCLKMFTTDGTSLPVDSCPIAIAIKEQRPVYGEQIIIQRPDGSTRHVLPYPTPLFDATGKLTGAVNMLIDITDKREKEILIKQTEEKYRNLIEQASDAIIAYSLEGTIYEFNQAVYKMLGYTKEEFEKINLRDILVGEIVTNPDNVEKMKGGETVLFNRTIKRKDGLLLEVEINSKLQPDGHIMAFVRDVTERKLAEQKLAESEKNLRQVLSSASDSFYVIDRKCYVTLINKTASENLEKAWGQPVTVGTNILNLIPNENDEPIRSSLAKVFAGETVEYELPHFIKNLPAWLQVNYLPVKDDTGAILGAYIVTKDITERKKAEEAIKVSEEKFRTLVHQAADGIFLCDLDGNYLEANEGAARITGYSIDELKQMNGSDIVTAEELKKTPLKLEEIKRGDPVYVERVIRRKDNILIEVEISAKLIGGGKVIIIMRDITERKKAEEAIRESNERYELATKATSDMVWDWNLLTGKVYRSKEGWKKLFKSDLDYSIGNEDAWELKIHPEDKERVKQITQEIINSADKNFYEIECRVLRDDKSCIYIHDKGYIMRNEEGRAVRLVGATQDITERRMAEEELIKLSIIAKQTSNAVIITDIEDRIIWVNEAFTRITEYELAEVIGKRPGDFLQGTETNMGVVRFMRRKVAAMQPFECDIINYTKSGKKHWFRIQCQPQFDASGKITGFFSIQADITKEKEAEEAIKASEEKYRYLFDNNASSIMIWDLDNLGILEVNENAIKEYGYSREEFLQLNLLNLRLPEDHSRLKELAEQLKSDADLKPAGHWKHINKAGEIMYMYIASHSIYFKGRRVIMAMSDNVTEKMQLEQELETEKIKKQEEITDAVISAQEKERQEIGRELHDNINQILATSRLYLGMAKTDENNKAGLMEETDNLINSAINEIRALSHSLIPPSLNESELIAALEDIINTTERMTGITIKEEIRGFDENTISDKFKLALYRIVQEQFSNIIKYAATKTICLKLCQEDKKIILSIKDDGTGFDTTKKATGIGLMNIKTRASLFNGEVSIISSPGHGCEVKVVFSEPEKTLLIG